MEAATVRGAGPERLFEQVRLLEVDPDLGAGIGAQELEAARHGVVVSVVTLLPGRWDPGRLSRPDAPTSPFAGLMLSGLVARDCSVAGRLTTQLVGPGDIVPLGAPQNRLPVAVYTSWTPTRARIAVLDDRLLDTARRWPWLMGRLVARSAGWADRALTLQAIGHIARVDLRIIALMWQMAERYGRVVPEGLVLPLRLSHQAIGNLVGAERPTVSLALKALRESGTVRERGGGWLLQAECPELLRGVQRPALPPRGAFEWVPRTEPVQERRTRPR